MVLTNLFVGQEWTCSIKSGLMDTVEKGVGQQMEREALKHTRYTGTSARCSETTWRGGMEGGWGEAQEGRDICVHTTESHCCTAETNTTL